MLSVSKPNSENGCWLWTGFRQKDKIRNYGKCWFLRKSHGEQQAHRVSYILFKGPIKNGKQILHTCDNPPCVNPKHLYAGTPQNNVDDRENRGRSRHYTGEKHGRAKLTWKIVAKIRKIHVHYKTTNGRKLRPNSPLFLARKYGVSKQTIQALLKNKTWIITN